jgi:hypothetical protein
VSRPTHSLAEHRQIISNLRLRLAIGGVAVLVFAFLCFIAWERDWSGFWKFISIAGVVGSLVAMASDASSLRDEKRAIRRLTKKGMK